MITSSYLTKYICVADLFLSAVLWTTIVVLGAKNRQNYRSNVNLEGEVIVPKFASWPVQLAFIGTGRMGR